MATEVCDVGLSRALGNSEVIQHHLAVLCLDSCHLLRNNESGRQLIEAFMALFHLIESGNNW